MITNPNAKRILCFGDSLTWGYIPNSGHLRFAPNKRWTGVLQDELGDHYEVIEEGLNSRGIDQGDPRPGKEGRRGLDYIEACLDTHDPIDYVVVLLGTNELKDAMQQSPQQISQSMHTLLELIRNRPSQFREERPQIILVAPPIVDETKEYARKDNKYRGAASKSRELAREYEALAKELGVSFVNSADVVATGADGVHIDAANHKKLGQRLAREFLS